MVLLQIFNLSFMLNFKNSKLPFDKKNGIRIYDGTFMGEDATVVVFYNERSKQVTCYREIW